MPGDRTEVQHKHRLVAQFMETRHLDAVILTLRPNFAWYTAGRCNHVVTSSEIGVASLFITKDKAICVTHTIEAPRVLDEELASLGIEMRSYPWYDAKAAEKLWSELLGGMRAACDTRAPGLPGSVQTLDPDFARLRWTMTESEIARYCILAREVAAGLETACKQAHVGISEFELAARIANQMLARGIRSPVILAAADERIRKYRHPIPTDKKFSHYGMGVAGGERDGLVVSCSRLFSLGPLSEDLARRHKAVCGVDAAMISATRPGKTLGEVFAVSQRAYAEAGFPDEWMYHHQGGLAGYLGREAKAVPGNPTPIQSNQFFAWNPSIAGTKSEDTILVGEQRNEILSATGDWPTTPYPAGDDRWPRSDILQL